MNSFSAPAPFLFHSPLSKEKLQEDNTTALLLQFMLSELLASYTLIQDQQVDFLYNPHPRLLPFDFGKITGPLNKLEEHTSLLPFVSEDVAKTFKPLLQQLIEKRGSAKDFPVATLRKLFLALEPLIKNESDNENLVYFILKHHKTIDALFDDAKTESLLLSLHPAGLVLLRAFLIKQFEKRGFSEIGCEVYALFDHFIKT